MYDPKIYVACLASYNAGTLFGAWIDATQDLDDIEAEIADMLKRSPVEGAEEWEIHDTEDLPDFVAKQGLAAIAEWAEYLEDSDLPLAVIADLISGNEGPEALDSVSSYDDREDYAFQLYGDEWSSAAGGSFLVNYIDWDSLGRDLLMDASSVSHEGVLYVRHS